MTATLSPRQAQVLEFISRFLIEHQHPPSVRDIARALHCSTSPVLTALAQLSRLGYLDRLTRQARSITITPFGWEWLSKREIAPRPIPASGVFLPIRHYRCHAYDACVTVAKAHGWPSWTCDLCPSRECPSPEKEVA